MVIPVLLVGFLLMSPNMTVRCSFRLSGFSRGLKLGIPSKFFFPEPKFWESWNKLSKREFFFLTREDKMNTFYLCDYCGTYESSMKEPQCDKCVEITEGEFLMIQEKETPNVP